jgi:AICAR transformylase/IMP cyclohydrolase PurH
MVEIIRLEQLMKLKGGENSHLNAYLMAAVDEDGKLLGGKDIRTDIVDLGAKERLPGWTNIGDISACLRTSIGLNEVYKESKTPHIAVASKHTRPVVIANGKTQLEAAKKAIAGDLNSPFGGFWGFNKPLDYDTAKFLDRMFIEGVLAPEFEKGVPGLLKDTSKISNHKNRFILQTGYLSPSDIDVFGYSLQPVAFGYFIKQDREKLYDARKEAVVITGNKGNSDINSLDDKLIEDINFAGNAAIYLASNLVFFAHNGAIAGLGDGCGARTVAAEKARNMLEKSAYAALSGNSDRLWDAVLYDTPFKREDFDDIEMPLRLTAFSDAFFPKIDGFVETSGIDRKQMDFGARDVQYNEKENGVAVQKTFIPKRNNYDPDYDPGLIPAVVVQPGGSLGDKQIIPIAEDYGIKMVFTMTPEMGKRYLAGEKPRPTGRRFFGHIIMS